MKNVRLLAIADTSSKARNAARAKGVEKVYDDYEKLLENRSIDCVVIALPTFLHAKCAVSAAECGKHVFIEKPLARNVAEGKEVVQRIRKMGVKAMVGYPLRFSEFAILRTKIRAGELGDVVSADATNIGSGPFFARYSNAFIPSPVPSWWFDPELTGGGALIDLGSHMINILRFFLGDEIVSVRSALGYRFNMPFEDQALCLMKFKQGATATVNVGWYTQQRNIHIELCGTTQSISAGLPKETIFSRVITMLGIRPPLESVAFYNELNHFFQCVARDKDTLSSAADSLKDLEIISQAYRYQV